MNGTLEDYLKEVKNGYYFITYDSTHKKLVGLSRCSDSRGYKLVSSVYNSPKYRGKGYAEARMMFMIKKFPKETFMLDCYSDNLPAVKLYTKCGFIVMKIVKHGKYQLLVMVRKPSGKK